MKKSSQVDAKCVSKMIKYVEDIREILTNEGVNSHVDLKQSLAAKYAVTQLITNIYELTKHMQTETMQSLPELNGIRLRTAR